MKLELARAGNHNGVVITPEDILSMAENFTSQVPVTIGHESDDSMPAYGWVTAVEVSADEAVLLGEIELGTELAEAFAEGRYKNWSIGAARREDDSLYLHHVAFLGAVPPMIKDLKIISMGDRTKIITFSPLNCGFVFSDSEMSEFSKLKTQNLEHKLNRLKEAAAGKLPSGAYQALISFADRLEREMPAVQASDTLAEIFGRVKNPVSQGTHGLRPEKAPAASIFSKI
ncbi:MAG: hypothetical protein AB7F25_13610 [Deferribacterales bacterium]